MSKSEVITFDGLSIEARTLVIKECLEQTLSAFEKSEDRLKKTCEVLRQQKAALGHGKWIPWLAETFGGDDATLQRIRRYLRKESAKANSSLLNYLNEAPESEGSDDPPKADRKTGQVEVIQPDAENEEDSDPSPTPQTNRKASTGNRKKSETTKTKTQTIVPEIVDKPEQPDPVDAWIESHSLSDLVGRIVGKLEDDKAKKQAAKQLRKLADKLDPPTKFVPPEVEEVAAYFTEIKCDLSPQYFTDFYGKGDWMISKGKPMKDWKMAARNANEKWDRTSANRGKSGTARVPAPPRKPVVYHD